MGEVEEDDVEPDEMEECEVVDRLCWFEGVGMAWSAASQPPLLSRSNVHGGYGVGGEQAPAHGDAAAVAHAHHDESAL